MQTGDKQRFDRRVPPLLQAHRPLATVTQPVTFAVEARDCITSRKSSRRSRGQAVQDYAAGDIKVTQTGQFVADSHFYLGAEPKLDA
jgi:hypothetical protein